MAEAFRANRYTTQSLTKCDQCGRVSHHIYRVPFGEFTYNLCSGECVERSRQNYESRKDIRFAPQVEPSPDFVPGMDSDE